MTKSPRTARQHANHWTLALALSSGFALYSHSARCAEATSARERLSAPAGSLMTFGRQLSEEHTLFPGGQGEVWSDDAGARQITLFQGTLRSRNLPAVVGDGSWLINVGGAFAIFGKPATDIITTVLPNGRWSVVVLRGSTIIEGRGSNDQSRGRWRLSQGEYAEFSTDQGIIRRDRRANPTLIEPLVIQSTPEYARDQWDNTLRRKLTDPTAATSENPSNASQRASAAIARRDGFLALEELLLLGKAINSSADLSLLKGQACRLVYLARCVDTSLRRASELSPQNPAVWYELGRWHEDLERPDDALKAFAEAENRGYPDKPALERHIDTARSALAADRPWHLELSLTGGYDSNHWRLAPDSDLPLGKTTFGGSYMLGDANVGARLRRGDWTWGADYTGQRLLPGPTELRDISRVTHIGSVPVTWTLSDSMKGRVAFMTLRPRLGITYLGGTRADDSLGASLEAAFERLWSQPRLSVAYDRHSDPYPGYNILIDPDTLDGGIAGDRSHDALEARAHLTPFNRGKTRWTSTIASARAIYREDPVIIDNHTRVEWSNRVENAGTRSITIAGTVAVARRWFQDAPDERRDTRTTLGTDIDWRFIEHIAARGGLQYETQTSTRATVSYRRVNIWAGTQCRF